MKFDYYYGEQEGPIRLRPLNPSKNLFRVLYEDIHVGYLTLGGDKYVSWNATLWDSSELKFVGAREGFQVRREAISWFSDHLGKLNSI